MELWGLALVIAAMDWLALWMGWMGLDYLAKPGAILVLITWLLPLLPVDASGSLWWFASGLGFSLAGDVLLMLPRERFIGGLFAFLLAHLAYIGGLNRQLPPVNLISLAWLIMAIVAGWIILRRVRQSLHATGRSSLQIPVAAYGLVISAMLVSAWLTWYRPDWTSGHALLVSGGATLFYASDVLLAWNRFVRPISRGRLRVRILYHLGQIGLITGVVFHVIN